MTREQILESISLKKRFCKDNNYPVAVFDNPYFLERLAAIDEMFGGAMSAFDEFCDSLKDFETEQDYFEHYNSVKEMAITYIKEQPDFIEFNNKEFSSHLPKGLVKRNLYVDENDDCTFISIDMKKANFSALHYYSPSIFGNVSTWEEFMGMFTDNSHIINSKYIRQVIMGACNPERQIKFERYLMYLLSTYIKTNLPNIEFYSVAQDEILIKIESDKRFGMSMKDFKELIANEPTGIGKIVRVEYFFLSKIADTKGWCKNFAPFEQRIEFKCLNTMYYHQVVKYFLGKKITANDLTFYYEGNLARFLKPITNPFN